MMKKRILSIVLAALLMLSLTACSGIGGQIRSIVGGRGTAPTPAPPTPLPTPSRKPLLPSKRRQRK